MQNDRSFPNDLDCNQWCDFFHSSWNLQLYFFLFDVKEGVLGSEFHLLFVDWDIVIKCQKQILFKAYFEPVPSKCRIWATRFSDFESTNIVTLHELNNNKYFSTKCGNTNIYRNSFFVRTVHDWNQLDNSTVSVTSAEAFRACLSCD